LREAPRFRAATRADIPAIVALNDTALPHVNALPVATWQRFVDGEASLRVAEDGEGGMAAMTAALPPGRSYGSLNYAWFQRRMESFLYLDRIVVAARLRRRGVGSAAYRDVFASAPDPAVPVTCEVNLDPPNDSSLAFHGGLGFREVGVQSLPGSGKRVAMLARRPGGIPEPSLPGPEDGATLRRAAATDAAMVARLLAELGAKPGGDRGGGDDAAIAARLATGHLVVLLAEQRGGDACGFAMLDGGTGAAVLAGLRVAHALRGRGTGARLLAAARREAMSRGWRRLEVAMRADAGARAASAFLRANGFAPAGPRLVLELA
jgi:predicted GNAT superfamily acetyltransferase